jgi:16S rRNA (uracil1498-N3)-methyltransferase
MPSGLSRLHGSLTLADRFFCPDSPVAGRVVLEGDEARHLTRVRRVAVGECVELFDGRGSRLQAEVTAFGRDKVELLVVKTEFADRPATCSLTLASAVPKGDRFDWLIEKATELGVARLIPLVTERSVVDPRSAKLDRLRRTVIEAAKQCRRDWLMELKSPTSWSSVVETSSEPIKLIAHRGAPGMASMGLNLLEQSAILAIGPEGGFTDAEVEAARSRGWIEVGLGSTVLRIETAALAGSATFLALAEAVSRQQLEEKGA